MKRWVYLVLAGIGLVFPYYFLLSFLVENGLNLELLLAQLFANDISTFFAVDLIITAVAFWVFLYWEARRMEMRHWWVYVVFTLFIGPSFAFPLFLYAREGKVHGKEIGG